MIRQPEPWLRGPLAGVSPFISPLIRSFEQAREDLAHWTEALAAEQLWARPLDLAPVGFHLRHIAGSVDRLTAYAQELPLTAAQMEALRVEMEPGAGRDELLHEMNRSFERSQRVFLSVDTSRLAESRFVGRQQLPTTLAGLIAHIAEHTQRHAGQAIVTAKVVQGAIR